MGGHEYRLRDFKGNGDYVNVKAEISSVFMINKDSSGMPDLKGKLTDDSMESDVIFVVADGVSHPYFEMNTLYKFQNVKDHYYDSGDEVQILVTGDSQIEKIDGDGSPRQKSNGDGDDPNNNNESTESASHSPIKELGDKFFEEQEEFTITSEEEESLVGSAKKSAKSEGRDPAIDSRLIDQSKKE